MKTAYLILFIRPSPCGTVGCTAHRPHVERAQIASEERVTQLDVGLQQAVMLEFVATNFDVAQRQLREYLEAHSRYKWVRELLR